MEPQIELYLLNDRLRIMSVEKSAIHKLAYPIIKIAFTRKTECKYFSFNETNDDYTIITDNMGLKELEPYFDTSCMQLMESVWIPMILCGEDLSDAMSITKISKYVILPLADVKISILAISMYQSDYILIQEKDYNDVIDCLSNFIPKIFDQSFDSENELVFQKKKGQKIFKNKKSEESTESKKNTLIERQRSELAITLPLILSEENEYCIIGLYNQDAFSLIIPTLIDIMFYESNNYETEEIFFSIVKKEHDISIVMETKFLKNFPSETLLNIDNNYWKMLRIGKESVGIEIYGVCASVSLPLEKANIDEFYISSFHTGYCFIPSEKLNLAKDLFEEQKANIASSGRTRAITVSQNECQFDTADTADNDDDKEDDTEVDNKKNIPKKVK